MKTILLAGLAVAGLSLTTLNSRADGLSFSISLGHDHHHHAPAVVCAPSVIVHPVPVCGIVPPPVHVHRHGHYRGHRYTHRDYHHDRAYSRHGFGSHAARRTTGIHPTGVVGIRSAPVTGTRTNDKSSLI